MESRRLYDWAWDPKHFGSIPLYGVRKREGKGGAQGRHVSEDGPQLSASWESYAFPTQQIRAAGIFGGAILVPLTCLGLPPDVVPRRSFCERRPYYAPLLVGALLEQRS